MSTDTTQLAGWDITVNDYTYHVVISEDGTFSTTSRTRRALVADDLKTLRAKIQQADKPKPRRVNIPAAVVDGDHVRNITVRGFTEDQTRREAVLITWADTGKKDKVQPYVAAYRPLTDDERAEYDVLRRLEREATARRAQWLTERRAGPVTLTTFGGQRIERNPDLRALINATREDTNGH